MDLADAIGASENKHLKFADVRRPALVPEGTPSTVSASSTRDGRRVGRRARGRRPGLKDRKVDVLSPTCRGFRAGDKFYAQCCLDAKVAFVKRLPVFIASDPAWAQKVHRRRRADCRRTSSPR